MNTLLIRFIPFLLLLGSCNSNPYPVEGGEIVNGKAPVKNDVTPAYSIDIEDTLRFKEGVLTKHKVKFFVPNGDPIVEFKGLPKDTYDKKTGLIQWKPGFQDANDPQDVMVKVKRIPVEVWLRSKSDQNTAIRKNIILEITDTPRKFEVTRSSLSYVASEGEVFEGELAFINEDYPNGDFQISAENLPLNFNANIKNNKVIYSYLASFDEVTTSDDCSYYNCEKKYTDGKLNIIAPDGRKLSVDLDLTVDDIRHESKFIVPDEITQGTEVSFIVSAMDPNSEVEPRIQLVRSPNEGNIIFEKIITKSTMMQTHMKLNWNNIPENLRGTYANFRFQSCVKNYNGSQGNCNNKSVTVYIKEQTHKAPIIDRSTWPLASDRFLGFNKEFEFDLDIKDGDDEYEDLLSINIFPKEMEKYVSFNYGTVTVQSDKVGKSQFQITAKSIYGITSSESFIFETLPKKWSKNLYLINALRSQEVSKNKSLIKSLDTANPDFQKIDKRMLSERETLILGTDILMNKEKIALVSNLSTKFNNIVLMSPLLNKITGSLSKEIKSLGVGYAGRFNDVVKSNLNDYYFIVGKNVKLPAPMRKIYLNSTLTSESKNPLILNKKINSSCTSLLSIGDDITGLDHTVSIKCKRDNGGYILINGFEFGDLKATADDKDIPMKWLKKLMLNKTTGEE